MLSWHRPYIVRAASAGAILISFAGPTRAQEPVVHAAARAVIHSMATGQTVVSSTPTGLLPPLAGGRAIAAVPGYTGSARARIQKVFPPDTRQRVSTTQYPWSAQCKLRVHFPDDTDWNASGTLIASRYLLTAGHCVYHAENGGWATRIEVVPGQDGDAHPFGEAYGVTEAAYAAWVEDRSDKYDWDMALVALDRDVGYQTGWLGVMCNDAVGVGPDRSDPLVGSIGNLSGYPADLDGGECQYCASGPIDGATDGQVFFHFSDAGGDSGAGIYQRFRDGSCYVFAVASWENPDTNGACRINQAKFGDLQSWLANGG